MCLLIYKPAGAEIPKDYFKNAQDDNPDGFGLAYVKDGRLNVFKGLMKPKKAIAAIERNSDVDLLIHFRRASPNMKVTGPMCHPFLVTSKTHELENGKPRFFFAIAHNGKLSYPNTEDKSDTACFVDDIIGPALDRDPWLLDHDYGKYLMEEAIGFGNKMAVMRFDAKENEANVFILNDTEGYGDKAAHWKDKVWFSNYSYLPPPPKVTYAPAYPSYVGQTPYPAPATGGTPSAGKGIYQSALALLDAQDDDFTKPDKDGWKWDFNKDCWINVHTKVQTPHLVTRPKRPFYIEERERIDDARDAADADYDAAIALSRSGGSAIDKAAEKEPITDDGKIIAFKKGKEITVPRDSIEVEDDAIHLAHLEPKMKVRLRRIAVDHFKSAVEGDESMESVPWTIAEMITYMRSDVRELFPKLKQVPNHALDQFILFDEECDDPDEVNRFMDQLLKKFSA